MKHLKKMFLSVLLAVAMVITCFSLLCSCGEQAPKMSVDPSTGASHGPTQSSGPAESNIPTQSTAPTQISTPTQNTIPTQGSDPTQNGNGTTDGDNGDYAIGGSGTLSEVLSAFVARCKIQKTFSAEDAYVPVEFSFGVVEGCSVCADLYEEAVVFMISGDGQWFIIRRHSSKELESPEYAAKVVWDAEHKHAIDYEYSHTETINLPLSMFAGDSGRIWIGLHVCILHDTEQHKQGEGGGVWLFYEYNEATNSIRIVKIE